MMETHISCNCHTR